MILWYNDVEFDGRWYVHGKMVLYDTMVWEILSDWCMVDGV